MDFEYDIFFSYKTSNKEIEEWINNLRRDISILLGQIFNKPIKSISSNEIKISSEIMMTTRVFVAIETKEYVKDTLEQSYLEEFNKLTKGKRIFKIVKEELEEEEETALLKSVLPVDFYHADLQGNFKVTHDKFFKTEAERLYWLKVVDLAYAIYKITPKADRQENTDTKNSKTIFVAETSDDQIKFRDIIIRELTSHGYQVLPDAPLPHNRIDFEHKTLEYLKKSDLAIHVMGEKYGRSISGGELSRVEVQNRLASEVYKINNSLERLLWLSPTLKDFEEQQSIYLEQLRKDIDELEGAEFVQTPLEIFKTIIRNKLVDSNKVKKKEDKTSAEEKSIYLINGQEDVEKVAPLEKWIEESGFHLIKSEFVGKRVDLVQEHRRKLSICDGVIVFYAHSNPQWIKMKLQDLVKAPGFGRKKPMLVKAIYSLLEEDFSNDRIKDLLVIKEIGSEFNSNDLKELVIKMNNK